MLLNIVVLKEKTELFNLFFAVFIPLSTSPPSFPCSHKPPPLHPHLHPTLLPPHVTSFLSNTLRTLQTHPCPWADETDEEEEEEESPPRQKRKHSTVFRKPGNARNSATVCDNMYLPPITFIYCFVVQLPYIAVHHLCFNSNKSPLYLFFGYFEK